MSVFDVELKPSVAGIQAKKGDTFYGRFDVTNKAA